MSTNAEFDAVAQAADELDRLAASLDPKHKVKIERIVKKLRNAFHAYSQQGDG